MTDVFVLDWIRTPRGKASPKGGLHSLSALDLVTGLQRELIERTGLAPDMVDDVVLGVASQAAADQFADPVTTTSSSPLSAPSVISRMRLDGSMPERSIAPATSW